MIAAKIMGANVATKKREIPAQQKTEIQVKIIALAAASLSPRSFPRAHFSSPREPHIAG
jgi:hypothetical protein